MKYYELDQEELELLAEIEKNEWKSIKDFVKRKKELMQVAKNTQNKTKNINIRLSERDLHKLKAKAAREGIPYQTLASSILHKAAE